MMQEEVGAGSPLVQRITVDEKLDKNLVRILVAALRTGKEEFTDDPRYWRQEKDLIVSREKFWDITGMAPRHVRRWPWGKLFEGQVFLQGYFKTKPGQRGKPVFIINRARKNLLSINDLIKDDIKSIYFSALKGGGKNV
jgi:hypothetical protein